MNAAKDFLGRTTLIALIMLAIVGMFYSTMDRPNGKTVVVSLTSNP
jgi:hypothetical protein